jgi:hypothetical protein
MQSKFNTALACALGFALHLGVYQASSFFGYFKDSNYAVCLGVLFCLNRIAFRFNFKCRSALTAWVQLPLTLFFLALVGQAHAQFLEGIKIYVPRAMFGKQDDSDYGKSIAKNRFSSAVKLNPTSNKYLRFSLMTDLMSGPLREPSSRFRLFPFDGDLCLILAWHKYLTGDKTGAGYFWDRGLALGGDPKILLEVGKSGEPWK